MAAGNDPGRRIHRMDFGAEVADGGVRFRLWAPDIHQVVLCLEEAAGCRRVAMERRPAGWHHWFDEAAGPGSHYCFQLDGGLRVPDPAARFQPGSVHGASMVVDPLAHRWQDGNWRGRPLHEAVFYELHVGAFTPAGTFAGVAERLDYLADLGVTAIELMPVAAFAGRRNWGYDGVLPFAPASGYGTPDELKSLVEAAHHRQLMIFLDVVYNHFGPEGNYLHLYASPFFTDRYPTPWGEAIDFGGPECRWVRRFFIDNALYWLEEFRFDGLRLDAVHAIHDPSTPGFLEELAAAVHAGPGKERQVHLLLENDGNDGRLLVRDPAGVPRKYGAQWNDDAHHALHVLLTGESDGYYADYAVHPVGHLGRCLAEGFAFQGEQSAWRGGRPRGTASAALPPEAFVDFLQNHDQIGNRAFGERLTVLADERSLQAATAVLLLSPHPPLLFMGQEWGSRQPFLYFCDFGDVLAPGVRDGRRREFAGFSTFRDPEKLELIPDPSAEETFRQCVLDGQEIRGREQGQWLALHRHLLTLRQRKIVPRLGRGPVFGRYSLPEAKVLVAQWRLSGATLTLAANFGDRLSTLPAVEEGSVLYASDGAAVGSKLALPPWSVAVFLEES